MNCVHFGFFPTTRSPFGFVRRAWSRAFALLSCLALAGCGGSVVPPATSGTTAPRAAIAPPTIVTPGPVRTARAVVPPAPWPLTTQPAGTNARAQGVRPGPPVSALGITPAEAAAARTAFLTSCPSIVKRTDASGLTRGADWQAACDAARAGGDALAFFANNFEAVTVGAGQAFATGYYEPEIKGSRERRSGYQVPIYRRPPDLIDVDLGLFSDTLKGRKIRGQVQGSKLGLYPDRAAIDGGVLAGKGLEIAWAADPIEFFFLQVQGSGLIELPDGDIMRIGYDTQNGRDYTGIGKLLKDRGMLAPGQSSMQGIKAWLRANPDQARAILHENKSFVFFRELGGPGPLGAMGYPVTGRMTVAADPAFIPLGAPVFLSLDRADASGLWIAQDTGGAIKGPNRVDTYWGSGDAAAAIAGGMSARGNGWLLLPRGTLARLNAGG